jgi:hypothetical protein
MPYLFAQIYAHDWGHDQAFLGDGYDQNPIRTVTTGTGAVPEPATWAMLLLGFGAIGATIRRREAKVAVSYAGDEIRQAAA